MGRTQVRRRVVSEYYSIYVLLHLILVLGVVVVWFCRGFFRFFPQVTRLKCNNMQIFVILSLM